MKIKGYCFINIPNGTNNYENITVNKIKEKPNLDISTYEKVKEFLNSIPDCTGYLFTLIPEEGE